MIEKIYKNKYMVTCDNCGTGQEFDTWTDALEYMFEEGWKRNWLTGNGNITVLSVSGKRYEAPKKEKKKRKKEGGDIK